MDASPRLDLVSCLVTLAEMSEHPGAMFFGEFTLTSDKILFLCEDQMIPVRLSSYFLLPGNE